jgi:7-keto-8-aminopelargonate synthetase-like enzyme
MMSLDAMDELISEGIRRGIGHLTAEDDTLDGRTVRVSGRDVVHFGSCSYLGLETDARLRDGAIDAVCRFGTQFASSRAFVSAPQYEELEGLLATILRGHVLCAPTTTLAHLAALPVLIGGEDAVVVDQMAHASVQLAARNLHQRHTPCTLRHNSAARLEDVLKELGGRRTWYLADGVYSMYGDRAPIDSLNTLMDRYPELHLYIDDAHGMSWTGRNGSGSVVGHLRHPDRAVVAVSLVKAFAAGGAAVTSADPEFIRRIRLCGPPMMFSGPIQPPMLGAAVASARIHISSDIDELQRDLRLRLHWRNSFLAETDLVVLSEPTTPITFVGVGRTETAYRIVERLLERGYYVNAAVFPAVSMNRAGVRFTVTRHHTKQDVEGVIQAISLVIIEELDREGETLDAVRRTFRLPGRSEAAA